MKEESKGKIVVSWVAVMREVIYEAAVRVVMGTRCVWPPSRARRSCGTK